MQRTRTYSLIGIALLSLVIAGLHITAQQFFFYWTFWWYDIMMHGLGGLLIGLMTAWVIAFPAHGILPLPSSLTIILVVLSVGIAWEVFEYVVGANVFYSSFGSYALDTISDIAMDVAGALGATLIFQRVAYE